MRTLAIIGFFMVHTLSYGQSLDSLGMDNRPQLSRAEARYLNDYFSASRADFDFSGKKVAYVTGSAGKVLSSKKDYFEQVLKSPDPAHMATSLVRLTAKEKQRSGGYDAVITYWVKVFMKGSKSAILRKLSKRGE